MRKNSVGFCGTKNGEVGLELGANHATDDRNILSMDPFSNSILSLSLSCSHPSSTKSLRAYND